ncbi:MAG: response regulator [Anaerolineae bacterium]|nr:response regulator [Anaerolineae bacterium]
MHALIVEDDDALQEFYETMLERSGFVVDRADSAPEAIAYLEHTNPFPSLVMLDIRMPGGLGFMVLDYIQQHPYGQATHVAVVTAGTEFESTVRNYPFASFHLKPILPAKITEIAQLVQQRQ